MVIFCLFPYKILALRTKFLGNSTAAFIPMFMAHTKQVFVTFFFSLLRGRKKVKEEMTKILINNSLLTGQISVPTSVDEILAFKSKKISFFSTPLLP